MSSQAPAMVPQGSAGAVAHGHAGAEHHDYAHQFDSAEHQHSAAQLGMWVFIAQEVLFFGGLFLTYTYYRFLFPTAFAQASHHLDVWLGCFNTAVLIGSSLTMALAVHGAQLGKRWPQVIFLLATIALGSVFLGVKAIEYGHKFHEHLVPGPSFLFPDGDARHAQVFFSLYFVMTGLHALHMVIGIAVLAVLTWQAWRGMYGSAYYSPVELTGLYWHFVDIIWIFLFPLLYLIGRH
jgi:cytochrome c oxidase subunit 3